MRMSKPLWDKRTRQYMYRKAVPAKLKAGMKAAGYSEWEVKIPLGRDPEKAKLDWSDADKECQRRFKEAETGAKPVDFRRMAREWIKEATATGDARDALLDVWSPDADDSGEWVKPPQEQLPKQFLEDAFQGAENPYCPDARQALWEVIRAVAANKHTMMDAFVAWKIGQDPTEKAADEWRSAVRRFGAGKIVERLTRADIEAFKEAETNRGLARASIKKYLGAIKSVLDYSVDKGWREHNPAIGVKVREKQNAPKARLPYTQDHLKTIFSGPVHTEGKRPSGGAGEAAYWLPILGMYTGARLQELGQLRGEDVQAEGKVWYLDINDTGEGQSVKNASSRRKIPLHPEIVDRFLAFVGTKKGPLFPDLKPDIKGNTTGNWSKWWGRYQRNKLGIKDKRFVFHSFRHTFKSRCREAGLEKYIHDQLTGHASKDVSDDYGDITTKKLAEYVALIKFDVDVFGEGMR